MKLPYKIPLCIVTILLFVILFLFFHQKTMNTHTVIPQNAQQATFAGGCFWCLEPSFDAAEGVIDTLV